jgi:hypothetical protein
MAVADDRSIGAEVRQRNIHKPSEQGIFTEIGQGIQKGRDGMSICFDETAKPPRLKQLRAIVSDYLILKVRYIDSQK